MPEETHPPEQVEFCIVVNDGTAIYTALNEPPHYRRISLLPAHNLSELSERGPGRVRPWTYHNHPESVPVTWADALGAAPFMADFCSDQEIIRSVRILRSGDYGPTVNHNCATCNRPVVDLTYCWPCWDQRPEEQGFMSHRLNDVLQRVSECIDSRCATLTDPVPYACEHCESPYHDTDECAYCGHCDLWGHSTYDCDNENHYESEDDDCEPEGDRTDRYGRHGYSHVPASLVFRGEEDLPGTRTRRSHYPTPPTTEPYLGLEIEFEAVSGDLSEMVAAAHDSGIGWCGTDGSLSHGAEFKLYPSTYARLASSSLGSTIDRMRVLGARAWQPGSAGLHIHVSEKAFASRSHQWRFAAAHERLHNQLNKLAGRHSREWAKWAADVKAAHDKECEAYARHGARYAPTLSTSTKIIAGKVGRMDRYLAVNVTGSGTIELRFWRGSMWPGHVLGAAAIEDGIFHWTKAMTFREVREGLTWKAFTAYAVANLPADQVNTISVLASRRGVALHSLPSVGTLAPENLEVC